MIFLGFVVIWFWIITCNNATIFYCPKRRCTAWYTTIQCTFKIWRFVRICNPKSNFMDTKLESQVVRYYLTCHVVWKEGCLLVCQNLTKESRVHLQRNHGLYWMLFITARVTEQLKWFLNVQLDVWYGVCKKSFMRRGINKNCSACFLSTIPRLGLSMHNGARRSQKLGNPVSTHSWASSLRFSDLLCTHLSHAHFMFNASTSNFKTHEWWHFCCSRKKIAVEIYYVISFISSAE